MTKVVPQHVTLGTSLGILGITLPDHALSSTKIVENRGEESSNNEIFFAPAGSIMAG